MALARKAKKRRGRKLKPNVERTPSGRISRAREPHEDTRLVALAYREKQYGLPPDLAGHEKACTVLGRLWLQSARLKDGDSRKVTTAMREAGERYLALKQNERKALQAPDGLAKTGEGGSGGDIVTEDYIDWATRAVTLYEVAKGWLDDINVRAIVDHVVLADNECDAEALPYLVRGLSHLVKRMGIEAEVEA